MPVSVFLARLLGPLLLLPGMLGLGVNLRAGALGTAATQKRERAMTKPLDAFLSDLLCTNRDDPANARYLVPLQNAEDEEMAHDMAAAIYSARAAEYFSDDITQEQVDRIFEQALIDSRRMLCDQDYARIFEGD